MRPMYQGPVARRTSGRAGLRCNAHRPSVARSPDFACRDALAQKKAEGPFPYPDFNPTQPDPSKLPLIAPFLAKTATTFETWAREMQALGQPPTGRAAWADLVRAVESHARIASEHAAAAQSGDTETFTKDYYEGTETQDVLLAAANVAGVPECAAVDR